MMPGGLQVVWRWPWEPLPEPEYDTTPDRYITAGHEFLDLLAARLPVPVATPRRVAADERLLVCPACKGEQPKTCVRLLRSYTRREGVYAGLVDGEKLLCEECGEVFNLNYRTGVFANVGPREAAKAPEAYAEGPKPPVRPAPSYPKPVPRAG
jgi:uncharacterized protein YbaR (Trm112 family)